MFVQHRFDEGLQYGRVSAQLEPDVADRSDPLLVGLVAKGLYQEATEIIRRFEQQANLDSRLIEWWWCFLHYQQGDAQKLRARLDGIMATLETGTRKLDYTLIAFYRAWLDGPEAALPFLRKAYEMNEYSLLWPEFFYLPEQISIDPEWLAFWQQPRLASLIEIRRANPAQARIGWWKERPVQ